MKSFRKTPDIRRTGNSVRMLGKARLAIRITLLIVALILLANLGSPIAGAFGLLSNSQTVTMTQQKMPHLNKGNYAAWAKIDGKNILLGQFNVDQSGAIVDLKGKKNSSFSLSQNVGSASEVFVTIESSDVRGKAPSSIKIQQGKLSGNTAPLSFPVDYSKAKGSFMLGVMSKETDNAIVPVKTGIWFVSPQGNQVKKGLDIPDAPKGWSYAGWMQTDQKAVVKMGAFSSPSGSDDFNGYSPALSPPKFPGENFLQKAPQGYTFPQNVDGATTWITLEPDMNVGESPFPLVLFKKKIAAGQTAGKNISLDNEYASLPSMKVTVK